jgi:small subunit ribosomal protein S11e
MPVRIKLLLIASSSLSPLSKTIRFNVLKVQKKTQKGSKRFVKF